MPLWHSLKADLRHSCAAALPPTRHSALIRLPGGKRHLLARCNPTPRPLPEKTPTSSYYHYAPHGPRSLSHRYQKGASALPIWQRRPRSDRSPPRMLQVV
ncbi:hypothetical protein EYF80_058395 [Liparis tanakae]|uniref:Uncharacterized protein n=1 Tax=Liparis tanakae TaxID=230148 RepID=A0A4Z2ERQ0_9TELE|nr:hypothetical protein EYF80_058395 [Liparis tanakae]